MVKFSVRGASSATGAKFPHRNGFGSDGGRYRSLIMIFSIQSMAIDARPFLGLGFTSRIQACNLSSSLPVADCIWLTTSSAMWWWCHEGVLRHQHWSSDLDEGGTLDTMKPVAMLKLNFALLRMVIRGDHV